MKVNGTRVEDLAGTGLITNQRYVMPLWVTVPIFLTRLALRWAWRLTVLAVRGWMLTLPAVLLILIYAKAGGLGVLCAVMWALTAGLVWARRWPDSFHRSISQRARGAWRWQVRYRRGWHPAMDGTGLTRSTPTREVYVPRVTGVRSTAVVDTLHVRLLHGQTPTELARQAEGLRHVYAAHRCTVIEDAPGRVRVLFYARDPLTRIVRPIEPGAVPRLDALPVGRAEDGTIYQICLVGHRPERRDGTVPRTSPVRRVRR